MTEGHVRPEFTLYLLNISHAKLGSFIYYVGDTSESYRYCRIQQRISLPFLRRESVSCALCVVRCVCTRTLTWTIARLASRSVCLAFRLENVALSVLRTYELIGKIWDELEPSLGLADARRRLRIFP